MDTDEPAKPIENPPAKARNSAGNFMAEVDARAAVLQATGLSWRVARDLAFVQYRIDRFWPAIWGDDLQVLIFGDFDPPASDREYPALGITVMAGKVENTVIRAATCVVTARVKVREKSLAAALDGFSRVNTLLGIWTVVDWGNRGFGWWCHLGADSIAGVCGPIHDKDVDRAIAGLNSLPPDARHKVRAALYWIRSPMHLLMESHNNDTLRVYAGYWNAFECLVEAICLLRPLSKMKKQDKLDGINKFLSQRGGKLDIAALTECYRSFVDPGFVAKASHALRVCDPSRADGYIDECFRRKPDEHRLYAVRNAINHGDVDYENMEEVFRVGESLGRLKMIVLGMLGRLFPFPCPVDPGPLK